MATSELKKIRHPHLGNSDITTIPLLDMVQFPDVNIEGWGVLKSEKISDGWLSIPVSHSPALIRFNTGYNLLDDIVYRNAPIKTIEGNFFVDDRITNIYDSIIESQTLSKYTDNWDDDGAIGFKEIIYNRAITILAKYSADLLNSYDTPILSPEINLARDGSIDLEWRVNKNILLINVLNIDELKADYYAHNILTNTIVKGSLNSFEINDVLSLWMKCLV
ncbi:hypothetical protein [Flavobacterium pectinovorum]|uniref:Uncharacterized protein n=1 Tax=Flavobacterium pectinovorum TaxID=29533 RepID=A0A502ELY2_9FLAO|nr:hypothetical protein [Flavobacterium pectinovorum]TPG38477.1 hypothetical protein EAH81_16290 [Flavobacterium pectinovorum]